MHLIHREAEEKAVFLSDEQALTLYQRVGGVPAAIIYAIGRIAGGYSIDGVLRELTNHHGDIARFCFASWGVCILMSSSLAIISNGQTPNR